MPDVTAVEQLNKETQPKPENILPKNLARALGEGLYQAFEDQITTIKAASVKLKENTPPNTTWKEWVDEMEKPDNSFIETVEAFRTDKKIEIVPLSYGKDFKPSGEREALDTLETQEIIIEGDFLKSFLEAFHHRLRTNVTVSGLADLIEDRAKNKQMTDPAHDISVAYSEITKGLDYFTKPLSKIILSVKADGKVDITPIPLKKPITP